MAKSYDLGRSLKREGVSPAFATESTSKTMYPSVSLSSAEFPPVKDWQVGKTYELTVNVKMTGKRERGKAMEGELEWLSASA